MPDKYHCTVCEDDVGVTLAGKLRSHKDEETGVKCTGTGKVAVNLPPEGPTSCSDTQPQPANSATSSSASDTGGPPPETRPPITPTPTTETTELSPDELSAAQPGTWLRTVETLPGVDAYAEALAGPVAARQPFPVPEFAQPLPPPPVDAPQLFDQPTGKAPKVWAETVPMTPLGLEITHRVKEMFHGYSNRQERTQQSTLGPSEIGTPCDRRIALSLLRYPTVNPGGDNWASFVGTCGHTGMEEMSVWADAGSGRYAAEQRLTFPSKHVPKGTTDLIDRTLMYVGDWKFMGQWSLDKLKTQGPSQTYRVQAHTYAYGAVIRGEKVKHVAIIGMPRDKGNLDDMYVWTEPYNPGLARDALKRVDRLGEHIESMKEQGAPPDEVWRHLPMDNSDCRFCPHFMKGAATSEDGVCNGRN